MDFGELRRFKPFCEKWGTSRGGAIDRYYIDAFIEASLKGGRGRFLECGGQRYRKVIPSRSIKSYDVIDRDPTIPSLTIHADIQNLKSVGTDSFDVIICTQVLQYVERPARALRELHRVLRP